MQQEEMLMVDATKLDAQDLESLARVAEGRASSIPAASAERLLLAGLVEEADAAGDNPVLELTPAGLAFIRSSDQ